MNNYLSYEDFLCEVYKKFDELYLKNELEAIQFMFYIGHKTYGLGLRVVFENLFLRLININTDLARDLLHLIPIVSRWDVLIDLISVSVPSIKDDVITIINNQLIEDTINYNAYKKISTLAKWMPSENASSKQTKYLARILMKELDLTPKRYRKLLVSLRSRINKNNIKTKNKIFVEGFKNSSGRKLLLNHLSDEVKVNSKINKSLLLSEILPLIIQKKV